MLSENFVLSIKTLRECLRGDFALESLFCAQRLWILNLVFSVFET